MGARKLFWQRAVQDDTGATVVEYSFVLGLIALAAFVAVGEAGRQAAAHWQNSSTKISAVFSGKTGGTN